MFTERTITLAVTALLAGSALIILDGLGGEEPRPAAPEPLPAAPTAVKNPFLRSDSTEQRVSPELAGQNPDHRPVAVTFVAESVVSLDADYLSVHVRELPLGAVLDTIARLSGVAITHAEAAGDLPVSADFDELALDEGLRRLLAGHDVFYLYEAGGGVEAVWVYPEGRGRSIAPLFEAVENIEQDLHDPDPERRAEAMEGVIERGGERAGEALAQALQDGDEAVRYRALSRALSAGLVVPAERLRELAWNDPSELVRLLALSAIADGVGISRDDILVTAQFALTDLSPGVQTKALEILDQLEAVPGWPGEVNQPLDTGYQ